MNAATTLKQVVVLTKGLIAANLSIEQNYPHKTDGPGSVELITLRTEHELSGSLKNIPYQTIYEDLDSKRLFNIKLIDGALLQYLYTFKGGQVIKHRLSFFPAPRFLAYDEEPEAYDKEELYADVVGHGLVRFPIRFDFAADPALHKDIVHPKSHLSLGQYPNCRIPVSAPLSPNTFTSFVLRNFYHIAYTKFCGDIDFECGGLRSSISNAEKKIAYLEIPSTAV